VVARREGHLVATAVIDGGLAALPVGREQRLVEALRSLRVPRHVFKFMYRLLVAHCNAHIDRDPSWKITSRTFETELAVFQRDQDAFDRGLGAG